MRARLGINNCFAVKRWPRPADWAPIVRDDLGLEHVELSLDLMGDLSTPAERARAAEETGACLEAAGLRAETTFTGLMAYSLNLLLHPDGERRQAALAWYRGVIELSAALGAKGAGGHIGTLSVPDSRDAVVRTERLDGLRRDLATLAAHARGAGLEYLLVENLVTEREPSTISGFEALLSSGDTAHVPVLPCLDLGHPCMPGVTGPDGDPYEWLSRFGARAGEVQLQQTDGLGDRHWPFTAETSRNGRIEPERVLDCLERTGAGDVLLVLEVIPPFEQDDDEVIAGLQSSVKVWSEAIKKRSSA